MVQTYANFSRTLEAWLKNKQPKTIGGMLSVLEEKSFAFLFLVLMIFPAAPLPTGGITHVFEIIVAIIALQLMIGRTTLWLPDRLSKVAIGRTMQKKVLPFLLKRVEFIQKYSKPRMMSTLQKKWFKA
ncbi:MAG: exopolysaccharide biosynthesis protein, partial [Segetibacter sp.]